MLVEKSVTDGIARITLNRPGHGNALTKAMLEQLSKSLIKIDRDAHVLILEGNGETFCSGADLKELFHMSKGKLKSFSVLAKKVCAQIDGLKIPTIAAVKGNTKNEGLELAMCCDFRIASDKTKSEFSQVKIGYTPGFGATKKLPRFIGYSRALELLLTGAPFDAKTGVALGLFNQSAPAKSFEKRVNDLADHIVKNDPRALQSIKYLVHSGAVLKETGFFADQLAQPDIKYNLKDLTGEKD